MRRLRTLGTRGICALAVGTLALAGCGGTAAGLSESEKRQIKREDEAIEKRGEQEGNANVAREAEEEREKHETEKREERKSTEATNKIIAAENHHRELLENHVPVGKTGGEVEKLLGEPDQTQEFGDTKLWYYDVPGPRQGEEDWQLVFSGPTVASENYTAN
jgi:hypothetical protein